MTEPQIVALLFSSLRGAFLDDAGSWANCTDSFNRLRENKIEIIYLSDEVDPGTNALVKNLHAEFSIITGDSRFLPRPEFRGLNRDYSPRQASSHREQISNILKDIHDCGNYPVASGLSAAADLEAMSQLPLLAVMPGITDFSEDDEHTIYRLKNQGQSGWNEWAGEMLRNLRKVLIRRFRD